MFADSKETERLKIFQAEEQKVPKRLQGKWYDDPRLSSCFVFADLSTKNYYLLDIVSSAVLNSELICVCLARCDQSNRSSSKA